MQKLNVFFLSVLLLTFSITMNPIDQSYATSAIEEKATLKKQLAENAIADALDTVADEKSAKKIENAQKQLEKGNSDFENEKFEKAIKHYDKALKKIQKALKEPHMKKIKRIVDKGSGDFNGDGLDDVYLKIVTPKNPDKPNKVDFKITDACVNGATYDDAGMKMTFSTGQFLSPSGIVTEGFEITNKWFLKNDENKQIDPFTEYTTHFMLPETGDDMIQNIENKKGSFKHKDSISKLGGQSGWDGSFEFTGPPGEYKMNFFLPYSDYNVDGCDRLSGFAVDVIIRS